MKRWIVLFPAFLSIVACSSGTRVSDRPFSLAGVTLSGFSDDGKLFPCDGDCNWNYFNDYLVQATLATDGYDVDDTRSLAVSVSVDGENVWSQTRTGLRAGDPPVVYNFVVPNDVVTCETFTVKTEILGQSERQEKSVEHTAMCGE